MDAASVVTLWESLEKQSVTSNLTNYDPGIQHEPTPKEVEEDEDVWAALSPAGAVVFRAWLRQRGVDPGLWSS